MKKKKLLLISVFCIINCFCYDALGQDTTQVLSATSLGRYFRHKYPQFNDNEGRDNHLKRSFNYTIRLDSAFSKIYSDNLEELVGSIIEVDNPEAESPNFRILRNITKDTINLKSRIIAPKYSDVIRTYFDKSNVKEIRFLGINPQITSNQIYKFEQFDIASLTSTYKQLDIQKIPKKYKCERGDCRYYVITSAVITKAESRLYNQRTKKLEVSEFGSIGQAFGLSGKLFTSTINDDYRLRYFIYIYFVSLEAFLD